MLCGMKVECTQPAERRGPEGKGVRERDQQRKSLYENATM